ncbi:MAG: hypothetical protein J5804_06250, partial [Eggerthellaceae bacterium]|nr:hypothetical protein [Eggerthellaceae bacterium]
LEDIDFSDPDTERVLKVSGNAHAFCWIRDNQADALDLARFSLGELCMTRLVEPLLEKEEDGSVASPEVIEAVLTRVGEKLRAGKYAEAFMMVRKLRLHGAQADRVLKTMRSNNTSQAQELREYLAMRAAEPTEESDQRLDVEHASTPDTWQMRWLACVSQLDVGLLKGLVGEGVDVPAIVAAEDERRASCTLVRDAASAFDDGLTYTADQAKAFIVAALDAGVRFNGNGAREVMQVFRMFPGDEELFARLASAGFRFHVEGGLDKRGDGDTAVIRYLMSPFYGRVTAGRNRARSFERKALDWQDATYMLQHGAVLRFDCALSEEICRAFRQHPWEFASMAKEIPPQSMVPLSNAIGLLASLGEQTVIDVLCAWENLFDAPTLTAAIDACAQQKMTEACAYLLELHEVLFSGAGIAASLEL